MQTPAAPSKIFSRLELEQLLCRMVTPLGLQASDNDMFKGAVFGRDSLLTVDMLLESGVDYSWLSDLALTSQARMRGLVSNPQREEEPGKFAHELRVRSVAGMNLELYDKLKGLFGEHAEDVLLTYQTVDATPLCIILAAKHARRWGRDLLRKEVGHMDPSVPPKPLGEIVRDGVEWITRTIQASPLGLLEYARANLDGHEFHVLEDGKVSYRHEDGKYPNLSDRIAYLTTQGQAHEALLCAAELFPHDADVLLWRSLAQGVQTGTLKHFWMPEQATFACALDRDPNTGTVRQMKTLTTVQPSILDSTIFDGLEAGERQKYVEGVLRNLFTSEFMTEVGVRSLAMRYDHLTPYWAYQGTRSVWPVLTHRAARGCRRQGYFALAADLDARMLNGLQTMGEMRELVYVSTDGRPVYDPEGRHAGELAEHISAPEYGQSMQTWTIAATLAAKHWLEQKHGPSAFERELLGGAPTALLSERQLQLRFQNRYQARVDLPSARLLEAELCRQIT